MRALNEYKTSTYTGTGAAVSVSLGFKPAFVLVWNETDGDVLFLHIDGMTAGSAISIDTEVAAEATNYVTLSSSGFSVGTGMSESAKVFRYLAF